MIASPSSRHITGSFTGRKNLVLFYRDFQGFSGGHLKVWDYFNHVLSSTTHEPRIAFSERSRWDAGNPWLNARNYVAEWAPDQADILFLAGTDWRVLPKIGRRDFAKPIINLIQHPRHAQPHSELRRFLKNRAVRVCVSNEVADAIAATAEVNGPVFVIPNGIDLDSVPRGQSWPERPVDILICALKAKQIGRDVRVALRNHNSTTKCLVDPIPRTDFLRQISEAKVTVFLPRLSEGFYLPALEGMAAGTIVVCPDCFGNRGFCQDKLNCFRPDYTVHAIAAGARQALHQAESERVRMLENATATARKHSLEQERKSFTEILERVGELWRSA